MKNELLINLPVKDIEKSQAFFRTLGFAFKESLFPDVLHLMVTPDQVVNLFLDTTFKNFVSNEIPDTEKHSQFLLTINVDTKSEVVTFANKVRSAGGKLFTEPKNSPEGMFGFGFSDPDGHRWNIVYMNKKQYPPIKSYFDGKDTHGHLTQL